jgi:hypothetical protein
LTIDPNNTNIKVGLTFTNVLQSHVKSLKIQFGRVVKNFKLNASNLKKRFGLEMEIPIVKN